MAVGERAPRMRDHWWWRPGWRVGRRMCTFHVTFRDEEGAVDGANELRRLVGAYQVELEGISGLGPVPMASLHLTMQDVGFVDEVGADQLSAVADRAGAACAGLEPFDLTFTRAFVLVEAVILLPVPAEPVAQLRDTLRAAIGDVLGADAVADTPEQVYGFHPHVSIAYATAEGSARPYIDAVRAVRPEPATVRVRAASLIDLHRDERVYQWRTRATIPLGGRPPA